MKGTRVNSRRECKALELIACALMSSCDSQPPNSPPQNTSAAHAVPESNWSYSTSLDRIDSLTTRQAEVEGDVPQDTLGGIRMTLIDTGRNRTGVVFSNLPSLYMCYDRCRLRYRSDREVGHWYVMPASGGEHVTVARSDVSKAIKTIAASRWLIVDIAGVQPRFQTAGLNWPTCGPHLSPTTCT